MSRSFKGRFNVSNFLSFLSIKSKHGAEAFTWVPMEMTKKSQSKHGSIRKATEAERGSSEMIDTGTSVIDRARKLGPQALAAFAGMDWRSMMNYNVRMGYVCWVLLAGDVGWVI